MMDDECTPCDASQVGERLFRWPFEQISGSQLCSQFVLSRARPTLCNLPFQSVLLLGPTAPTSYLPVLLLRTVRT